MGAAYYILSQTFKKFALKLLSLRLVSNIPPSSVLSMKYYTFDTKRFRKAQ